MQKSKISKSQDSISSTKVVGLSKNDIISIIKHCHKYSVKRLSIEGLELEFPEGFSPQTASMSPAKAQAVDQRDLEAAQNIEMDNEIDSLMVTDPEAWEQGLLDGSIAANGKTAQV